MKEPELNHRKVHLSDLVARSPIEWPKQPIDVLPPKKGNDAAG